MAIWWYRINLIFAIFLPPDPHQDVGCFIVSVTHIKVNLEIDAALPLELPESLTGFLEDLRRQLTEDQTAFRYEATVVALH
jgi:hypothetical protein